MSDHEDASEIKRLRRELGLTQIELAQLAKMAENTVGAAENPSRTSTVRPRLLALLRQAVRDRGGATLLHMPSRSRALDVRLGDRDIVDVRHRVVRPGVRVIVTVAADADATDEDIQAVIDGLENTSQKRHPES